MLIQIYGEHDGRPARTAMGVASLPLGLEVEIEAVFETANQP